jgi:hypothetical protein
MIAGALSSKNKVRCVVFLERKFYYLLEKEAQEKSVSRSSILRRKLKELSDG